MVNVVCTALGQHLKPRLDLEIVSASLTGTMTVYLCPGFATIDVPNLCRRPLDRQPLLISTACVSVQAFFIDRPMPQAHTIDAITVAISAPKPTSRDLR